MLQDNNRPYHLTPFNIRDPDRRCFLDFGTVLVDVDESKNQIIFHAPAAMKKAKQPAAA